LGLVPSVARRALRHPKRLKSGSYFRDYAEYAVANGLDAAAA
jgi:hypothetical protein